MMLTRASGGKGKTMNETVKALLRFASERGLEFRDIPESLDPLEIWSVLCLKGLVWPLEEKETFNMLDLELPARDGWRNTFGPDWVGYRERFQKPQATDNRL